MTVRYSDAQLADAVARALSYAEAARILLGTPSPSGGSQAHMRQRLHAANIDISHFTHQPRGARFNPGKLTAADVLVAGRRKVYRRILLRAMLEVGIPYVCSGCQNPGEWQGRRLVLEIDHIDGDRSDCRRENLRFLCPNCHSQESTGTASLGLGPEGVHEWKPKAKQGRRRVRGRTGSTICQSCGGAKDPRSQMCARCSALGGRSHIAWPAADELGRLVAESSFLAVGRTLGVSDNAVRKHLRSRGVDLKELSAVGAP